MADDLPDLATNPIHLSGTLAEGLAAFDGTPGWYQRYSEEHPGEGFLVSWFRFSEPWDMWEMHPHGHEVVLCVAGTMTLHQETASGENRTVVLEQGQYAINEPGTWHTADVEESATGVFLTAGEGTTHRPR
jgi:mannose-6-phosphate isomerase-like protein (cupin superfamily)